MLSIFASNYFKFYFRSLRACHFFEFSTKQNNSAIPKLAKLLLLIIKLKFLASHALSHFRGSNMCFAAIRWRLVRRNFRDCSVKKPHARQMRYVLFGRQAFYTRIGAYPSSVQRRTRVTVSRGYINSQQTTVPTVGNTGVVPTHLTYTHPQLFQDSIVRKVG